MGVSNEITQLLNSFHYYLSHVYIVVKDGKYRLVVLRHNKVLTDRHYKTLEGAKIAFSRMYGNQAWKAEIKPYWGFRLGTHEGGLRHASSHHIAYGVN